VRGTNGNHVGATPTSVPPAVSKFLSNRRHDNYNNDDCLHVRAQTEAIRGVSELSHVNELVPGFGHFHNSVTSDLALPKFSDCKKQNIVNFLEELDSYFQLKDVPAEIKLQIAMKAITDEYPQQWVTAIYKELTNYEHFKQAITELLWRPQIQSQVRCSMYEDRFIKSGGENLSAHFLRYAMMAANLTPKMSELEVIDAISGHYPNYVQRAFLSANVQTVQKAFSFLNKLQIMEGGEARQNSNREPPSSRPKYRSSAGHNQSGQYRPRSEPQNVRYMRYRDNASYNQGIQRNEQSTGRESRVASPHRQRRNRLNRIADSYSPERATTVSRDRNVQSEMSRPESSRESM
jgi:hypothetical protein